MKFLVLVILLAMVLKGNSLLAECRTDIEKATPQWIEDCWEEIENEWRLEQEKLQKYYNKKDPRDDEGRHEVA